MNKEYGLHMPDGSFRSQKQIRREAAINGDVPLFVTPLPIEKDFDYWSSRFRVRAEQFQEAAEVKQQTVEITLPGSDACINFIGDLHVGSPYTDYDRIAQEIETIVNTPQSYVMLMGDLVDGFFFNPAQFDQMEQSPEQFQYSKALIEHLAAHDRLLIGWGGDHDNWAKRAGLSAYTHFAQEAKAHYIYGVGFVTLNIGDEQYRLTGAHRLPGHSMYNKNHPGMRAEKFGGARGSDIVVHGHTHQKGYALQPVSEFGGKSRNVHYISIGPYKATDEYARKLGFSQQSEAEMFGSSILISGKKKKIQYYDSILEANQEIARIVEDN